MSKRRHALIATFVALFVLQLGTIAHDALKTGDEMVPFYIVCACASAALDIAVARNMLHKLHDLEQAYASRVATQLEDSLTAFREQAAHADHVSLTLAHEVDEELALAQEALAHGDVDAIASHLRNSVNLASHAIVPRCENAVVSAILESKAEQCTEANVSLQTIVALPQDLPVEDVEIASIFLFLIDHALHTCQTQADEGTSPPRAAIVVHSKIYAGQFFAEVVGPSHAKTDISPWRPVLSTENHSDPSLGLEVVSDIATHHGGVFSHVQQDKSCVVSVLFPLCDT